MRRINRIVIHCSATPPDMNIGAAEIDAWHKERGWSGIGYHKVIRLNGTVELGRDPDQDGDVEEHIGAHAYGHNRDTLAVCYVGGVDSNGKPADTRTPAQKEALIAVVRDWMRRFSIPVSNVLGHYELDPGKACPSFSAEVFRADLQHADDHGPPLPAVSPDLAADLPVLRDPLPNPPRTQAQALLRFALDKAVASSIADFQIMSRLANDGICGQHTWAEVLSDLGAHV